MNTSKPPAPIACMVVGSAVDAAIRFMVEGKDEMHGEKKMSASGDVTYNTGTSHLHMTDEFQDKSGDLPAQTVRSVTLDSVKLSAGRSWALAFKDRAMEDRHRV